MLYTRICIICNEGFETTHWRKIYCSKKCVNKAEAQKKEERHGKSYFKHIQLRTNFGISLEKYQEMLKLQKGMCAICGKEEEVKSSFSNKPRSLSVDHCHTTGKIRGLLCQNCNKAIGLLKDNTSLLNSAIKYLSK